MLCAFLPECDYADGADKGLAVMEQLQENLEYAKDIQVQSGTDFPAGDENCAYQMLLWTDQDPDSGDYVLKASEKIQYSMIRRCIPLHLKMISVSLENIRH